MSTRYGEEAYGKNVQPQKVVLPGVRVEGSIFWLRMDHAARWYQWRPEREWLLKEAYVCAVREGTTEGKVGGELFGIINRY